MTAALVAAGSAATIVAQPQVMKTTAMPVHPVNDQALSVGLESIDTSAGRWVAQIKAGIWVDLSQWRTFGRPVVTASNCTQ